MTERVLPHSLEAEQAVLGAVMVNGDYLTLVKELVGKDDFFASEHAAAFSAFEALGDRGEPIDKVSVAEELRRRNKLDEVGGVGFLTTLLNAVPTSASVEYYAKIVAEKSALRRIVRHANKAEDEAYAGEPPADVCRRLTDGVDAILDRASHVRAHSLSEALKITDEQNDEIGRTSSIPFPLQGLNLISAPYNRERERGLRPGQMTTIAAKEKNGKSALCEMIAAEAVQHARVLYFAIELGIRETIERMAERISFSRVHRKVNTDDFRIVDNDVAINTERIAALVARHKPGVVVIDHAQHLQGWFDSRKGEGRDMEPTRILHRLNRIARGFKVHIVIAQQINRNVDSDKPPSLNDLRETAAFVALSHRVILLHRPYYGQTEKDNEIVLHIAANRSGPPGKVTCNWAGDRREIVDRIASVE